QQGQGRMEDDRLPRCGHHVRRQDRAIPGQALPDRSQKHSRPYLTGDDDMATKLKPVDVGIVGLGWTGGIIAKELASTKLKIVALERGGPRDTNPDFLDPQIHDELRYAVRHDLMQDLRRETLTFRNSETQTALPMRQLGSFLPGQGVGG